MGEAPIRRTRVPDRSPLAVLNTTVPTVECDGGFGAGLFPLHSPLLRESSLVSFPPLINMLKFSGFSRLISGRNGYVQTRGEGFAQYRESIAKLQRRVHFSIPGQLRRGSSSDLKATKQQAGMSDRSTVLRYRPQTPLRRPMRNTVERIAMYF